MLESFYFWVTLISRLATIGAVCFAMWKYIKNKEKISSVIDILLNYSKRITLNELKYKIELLYDLCATKPDQKREIINILSEIEGQIIGNNNIEKELSQQVEKIKKFIEDEESLTEPRKRSLVSELKESVRNIDVSNLVYIFTPQRKIIRQNK